MPRSGFVKTRKDFIIMKRFIIICAALIVLFATNSSGTSYQQLDELRTFIVQKNADQMQPAIVNQIQADEVQQFTVIGCGSISKAIQVGVKDVYCDPDYGLCRLFSSNKNLQSTAKNSYLPVQIVLRN